MSPLREGYRPCGTVRKTTEKLGVPYRPFDYTPRWEDGKERIARLPWLSGSSLAHHAKLGISR